jgi:alpha-L-fucosidase
MIRHPLRSLFALFFCLAISLPQLAAETPAERDTRMQWWREARLGMFIHWGLYAIPAGTWKDKKVDGIGEWIMNSANIPVADYEKLTKQFNPVKFDAAEWVKIAKDAGMKYIVITSKHHDGFCLFDSAATDYDMVDATPYKKDLLQQLADECKKQGLVFCVYYSIMDWHHPTQTPANENQYNPTRMAPEKKREYVDYMKAQLKELVTKYGVAVLWFDGEWTDWWTEAEARETYAYLRELKPDIIINNRVGKGREGMEGLNKKDAEYSGDFGTPEQQIPATGIPGVDWESCMTMNDTWGFRSDDHKWKSSEELIRNIIDIASKGGNYLLNVGPTADGQIPAPSVERLAAIGAWMKKNGESIYGTQASPFAETPWGRCTQKKLVDGKTRIYLHIFNWPTDGKLSVPALPGKVVSAKLLSDGKSVKVTEANGTATLTLPATAPDKIATVVVLDL